MNNCRKRFSIRKVHFVFPALLILSVFAIALHHFINVGIIFAADIPGSGAAIRPGCTWELAVSHCTEATWRYYSVTDDVNGTVDVSNPDAIVIKGTVDATAPGATLSGCAAVGGYWRYALVVNHDFQSEYHGTMGAYFYQGQQIGVGSIGGGSSVEHSNMWGDGGREQYSANPRSGGGGTNWDFVEAEYKRAYEKGYVSLGWNASSRLGAFCAETPLETDTTSPEVFSCYSYGDYTEYYGRTYYEAAVRNLSALSGSKTAGGSNSVNINTTSGTGEYKNKWKVTASEDSDSTTKVYARPGDSVQFRHTLCYGNQKVKGNEDFVYNGADGRTSQNTVDGTRYFNKRNFFNITAYKNDGLDSRYAFDSDSGTSTFINHGDYTIKETTENLSESALRSGANITGADFGDNYTGYRNNEIETANYGFRIYSPTNAANTRYNCSGMTAFRSNSYVSPGFQVPGYTSLISGSDTCDNVNVEHIDSNTVGVKISQKLKANIVKSWVARKSTHTKGTCTCSIKTPSCPSCSDPGNPNNKTEGTQYLYAGNVEFHEYGGNVDAWQDNEWTVYPLGKAFKTRVDNWESQTINRSKSYLPEDDDAANKPHGAHYEDYETALSGPGEKWGDWRGWGGCKYSTCEEGCNGPSSTYNTGGDKDPTTGAVTHTYYLTYQCQYTATGDYGYSAGWANNQHLARTKAEYDNTEIGYPYRSVSVATPTKTAEVYTPYNYDTSTSTTINTQPLYLGEEVKLSATVAFTPRNNALVGTANYATVTKTSHISVVQFIIPVEKTMTDVETGIKGTINYDSHGSSDHYTPCQYYQTRVSAIDCAISNDNSSSGEVYNTTGNYSGERKNFSFSQTIPDDSKYPVGSKYCIAVGVFPADSYNRPGAAGDALTESDTEGAGMTNSGQYWNISGATCRTITKKPNFQVWGAGVYTTGTITTSHSRKNTGAPLDYRDNYDFAPTGYFGSWGEYTAIANNEITGFASGATLGYSGKNLSATAGGYQSPAGSSSASPNYCKNLSVASVAHDDCGHDSAIVGSAGGITPNSSVLLNRLYARYTPPIDSSPELKVTSNVTKDSFRSTSSTSPHYAYVEGDATIAGDLVISPSSDLATNQTYILYVTGKLTINADICYGSTSTCNGGNAIVSLSGQNNGMSYNSTTGLPQLLIFAKDINISRATTQIDSWLIAEGTINTCEGRQLGKIIIHDGSGEDGSAEYIDGINSNICNSTLIINGPVFAGKLELVRTAGAAYGAGSDNSSLNVQNVDYTQGGSITPAEIFNLRPDAYLWAYNQAQRYSEAVVVYTREIPPRY